MKKSQNNLFIILVKTLVILITVNITSCKKVDIKEFNLSENPIKSVEFEEIKEWYKLNKTTKSKVHNNILTSFSLTPDFDFAQPITFKDSLQLIGVPFFENIDTVIANANSQLLFFRDSVNGIQMQLLFFVPTEEYFKKQGTNFKVSNFTGFSMLVSENGNIISPSILIDGKVKVISIGSLMKELKMPKSEFVKNGKCPNFKSIFWKKLNQKMKVGWEGYN